MKLFALTGGLVMLLSSSLSAQDSSLQVYFDSDQSEVTAEYSLAISDFIQSLDCDEYQIVLTGHTDADAAEDYNLALSNRRVEAVVQELLEAGIARSIIQSRAHGENIPVATNDVEAGKALNRRVEVTVQNCVKHPEVQTVADFSELMERVNPGARQVRINGRQPQVVQISDDHHLVIPQGAFGRNGRVVNGRITLHIEQGFGLNECLQNRLVTQTSEEMLSTAGMIRVVPMRGRDTLEYLQPVRFVMNTEGPVDSYSTFTGVEDTVSGSIIWEENPNPNDSAFTGLAYDPFYLGGCMCGGVVQVQPRGLLGLWAGFKAWLGFRPSRNQNLIYSDNRTWPYYFPDGLPRNPRRAVQELYEDYGMVYPEDRYKLIEEINKEEMDSLGIDNVQEFVTYKETENIRVEGGDAKDVRNNLLQYGYVMNLSNAGWYNCDVYSRFSPSELYTLRFDERINPNSGMVRIYSDEFDLLVQPNESNRTTMKKRDDIRIIAFKVEKEKIYLSDQRADYSEDVVHSFAFREVTYDEFNDWISVMTGM